MPPTPTPPTPRQAWMAVPLSDKLRWDQTSTDVNVWVVMPRGTRARDVKVGAAGWWRRRQ